MPEWTPACLLEDIELEGVRRFDHAGRIFAIFRSADDKVFCTEGLCTHEAVDLSEGLVMGYEIECPKHSGIFDIRTGEAKRLPACVNLRTYPARLERGRVMISV
jgi:3-phenylpropionate/trans-cinnamate dioxygenase ferredoxin component